MVIVSFTNRHQTLTPGSHTHLLIVSGFGDEAALETSDQSVTTDTDLRSQRALSGYRQQLETALARTDPQAAHGDLRLTPTASARWTA